MKSLSEGGDAAGLAVVGAREYRCEICPSFRAGRRARSCTSLLYDPAWVLGQRGRWPDHLCYADFMQRSVDRWVFAAAGEITPAMMQWASSYPLPLGEAAARHLYARVGRQYPEELTRFLPFARREEAYWALRVEGDRSVLDMFGLKGPRGLGDEAGDPWFGRFAYSLRGYDDTSLLRLVQEAAAWWQDFSAEKIQGRPRGSGTWESRAHFESALIEAGRRLRSQGAKVTQEAVADLLQADDRLLRRWLRDFDVSWRELKRKT